MVARDGVTSDPSSPHVQCTGDAAHGEDFSQNAYTWPPHTASPLGSVWASSRNVTELQREQDGRAGHFCELASKVTHYPFCHILLATAVTEFCQVQGQRT